ncbi:alpha/beta-hydrolase [Patellaria atrata CBS 101060]|uniref:Alpha/beta-hydrolase n=1 Tax=Patellaria atrata CBS 101060 TaxID=1346257 RepID=A0A9P4VMY3_9PEZI|nr:alpha/beta-hydrolase [Patellaria atrata CBS 101060]
MPDTTSAQRTFTFESGGEEIRIHYIDARLTKSISLKGTILLIHGFPQTSYQFRHVIRPFADAGYRVLAPDYRGAGQSSKPSNGFTKSTMAFDLLKLVREHLGIKDKIHIVGHDIGAMIAYAYASRFSKHVASVTWGECLLPGTDPYENKKGTPELFHFVFHQIRDLPEALIAGREEIYLKHFYDKQVYNGAAISIDSLKYYTTMFSQPGAMRCGIELYRAFGTDAEENREWVKKQGKCGVPSLILSGRKSFLETFASPMAEEVHENIEVACVEEAGHWIAEENPAEFVGKVLAFVRKHT